MKSTHSVVTALLLAALLGAASAADAALLQRQGKVTFLRVHDVGTGFGPPGDQIDVEVVFQLDTQPETTTPSLRFVEKGAVTEAQVKDAARAGVGLRLSRRAVLTPLARDQARALGVVVEKEA